MRAIQTTVQHGDGIADDVAYPTPEDFATWAQSVSVADASAPDVSAPDIEVCVRIVNDEESAQLNHRYRHKPGPTNVLSFPFDPQINPSVPHDGTYLGDVVMAAELIKREAKEQSKALHQHWAHLFIHGILHLQGYQHEDEKHAQTMEAQEINILQTLGFPDPYQSTTTTQ